MNTYDYEDELRNALARYAREGFNSEQLEEVENLAINRMRDAIKSAVALHLRRFFIITAFIIGFFVMEIIALIVPQRIENVFLQALIILPLLILYYLSFMVFIARWFIFG